MEFFVGLLVGFWIGVAVSIFFLEFLYRTGGGK
jgi:hypothetical protein